MNQSKNWVQFSITIQNWRWQFSNTNTHSQILVIWDGINIVLLIVLLNNVLYLVLIIFYLKIQLLW